MNATDTATAILSPADKAAGLRLDAACWDARVAELRFQAARLMDEAARYDHEAAEARAAAEKLEAGIPE